MMNQVSGGLGSSLILLLIFIGIAYVLLIPFFVAAIANKQGRSGVLWFFLSILLNPFFSILILIALGDTDEKRKQKVLEEEQIRLSIRKYQWKCDDLFVRRVPFRLQGSDYRTPCWSLFFASIRATTVMQY